MNNVVLTHLFPSVSIFKITYNLVVNNATDVLMSKASLTLPLQSGGINQKKKKKKDCFLALSLKILPP